MKINRSLSPIIFFTFLVLSVGTNAAVECKAPTESCMTECMNIGSSLDASYCYANEMAKADKELNAQYKRLTPLAKKYDAGVANALLRSEKAWIMFRDSNCELARQLDLDNHDFEHKDCILRLTRERAIELKDMADFIESRL